MKRRKDSRLEILIMVAAVAVLWWVFGELGLPRYMAAWLAGAWLVGREERGVKAWFLRRRRQGARQGRPGAHRGRQHPKRRASHR